MDQRTRIESIEHFWTRQFAWYLNEHRHPVNRLTHMVGIPLLIVTAVLAIARGDLWLLLGGQLVGWAIQIAGHRIEGNRPALLENPIAFLMGPLMVLVEMVELLGVRPAFATQARRVVFGHA